jgi:hypothetical protein
MIRRASSVREGLLDFSRPEDGLSSCGVIKRNLKPAYCWLTASHLRTSLIAADLDQGMFVWALLSILGYLAQAGRQLRRPYRMVIARAESCATSWTPVCATLMIFLAINAVRGRRVP